jgi:hypothetical protein
VICIILVIELDVVVLEAVKTEESTTAVWWSNNQCAVVNIYFCDGSTQQYLLTHTALQNTFMFIECNGHTQLQ